MGKPYFIEYDTVLPASKKKINVVLFGDIINLLMLKNYFHNHQNYLLWVLSHSHAKLVSTFLNIDISLINVIDRYQLYPITKIEYKTDKKQQLNFIYSGRITQGKNTELLIPFLFELQNVTNIKCTLHICYPQSDDIILNTIHIQSLLYKIPLCDHQNLGKNWLNKINVPNKIYINLSTYVFEDFSVSMADAQAHNIPVFLSDWGPFKNIRGPKVKIIALSEITQMQHGCFELEKDQYKSFFSKFILKESYENSYNSPPSEMTSKYIEGEIINKMIEQTKNKLSALKKYEYENFIKLLYFKSLS